MNVGDIVELLDESVHEGRWAGRMTVVATFASDVDGYNYVRCMHPDMGVSDIVVDDLVVMDEAEAE